MTNQDKTTALHTLIEEIRECMLVTTDPKLGIRSRPMSCSKVDEQGNLWFFTGKGSDKVQEVYQDKEVNCAFAKPSNKSYASVTGLASVIEDDQKKRDLYSPLLDAWFKGADDPNAVLLCIKPTSAEYWNDNSSTIVTFAKIAVAAMSGENYTGGQNEKVDIA